MAQYKAKILAGKHRKHKILCKIQIIRNNTTRYSIFFCFGKDEVGSSNLPSSSKKPLKSLDLGGFFIPDGGLERRGPVEDRISGIQSFRGLSAGADLALR